MADDTPSLEGIPAVCQEVIDLYAQEDQAFGEQRRRELQDLEFQVADPQHHWTEEARNMRAGQTINGQQIPAQPMLALPTLDQPIQLILNQERAAHLAVSVHPLSEDADDDTAEAFNDIYRGIQRDSRAGRVRSWGFERAVKSGRGAYRVLAVPDPSGQKGDLKLVLRRLLYQESARWDPYAEEPDFSDAEWGMVSSWVPLTTLKRKHKGKAAELTDCSDGDFAKYCQEMPLWVRDGTKGRAALVVEYFRKVYGLTLDENGETVDGDEDEFIIRWSKVTCTAELETSDMDCRDIPLVPCIGRELIPFDAERRWEGIIRPNKDAARIVDYAGSNAITRASLEPKAPWMIAEGQDETHEQEFALSSVRNFPALHYKPTALGDKLVPPPARTPIDMAGVSLSLELLQFGLQQVHGGTGAWEAALGQAAPNAKTKGGTLALQQQHDQGNSHWLDNQVEITLACESRIVVNWIPYVYDRPGRILYGLDAENRPKPMMLGKRFAVKNGRPVAVPEVPPQAPQQPGAVLNLQQPPQPHGKYFDLKKGRYGVTPSAGKDYKSRVEEGSDRLGQLLQADPQLVPLLGPNWMHFQDFPGHDEAEDILRKMRDQQYPFLRDQDEQPDAAAQLQQAHAALTQLQQQAQGMQKALETEQAKQQATIAKAKIDADVKLKTQAMDSSFALKKQAMVDATAIAVAQINAIVKGVQMDSEAINEAQATGHAASEGTRNRAHELALVVQQHQQQLDAAQQDHARALELSDQGHQQQLEQGQQAADLAPEPAADSGAA